MNTVENLSKKIRHNCEVLKCVYLCEVKNKHMEIGLCIMATNIGKLRKLSSVDPVNPPSWVMPFILDPERRHSALVQYTGYSEILNRMLEELECSKQRLIKKNALTDDIIREITAIRKLMLIRDEDRMLCINNHLMLCKDVLDKCKENPTWESFLCHYETVSRIRESSDGYVNIMLRYVKSAGFPYFRQSVTMAVDTVKICKDIYMYIINAPIAEMKSELDAIDIVEISETFYTDYAKINSVYERMIIYEKRWSKLSAAYKKDPYLHKFDLAYYDQHMAAKKERCADVKENKHLLCNQFSLCQTFSNKLHDDLVYIYDKFQHIKGNIEKAGHALVNLSETSIKDTSTSITFKQSQVVFLERMRNSIVKSKYTEFDSSMQKRVTHAINELRIMSIE